MESHSNHSHSYHRSSNKGDGEEVEEGKGVVGGSQAETRGSVDEDGGEGEGTKREWNSVM